MNKYLRTLIMMAIYFVVFSTARYMVGRTMALAESITGAIVFGIIYWYVEEYVRQK